MGPNKWPPVKDTIVGHDVKGTFFGISLDFSVGQPLKIKEFKLEATTPYVYDRFIRVCGMFPHYE